MMTRVTLFALLLIGAAFPAGAGPLYMVSTTSSGFGVLRELDPDTLVTRSFFGDTAGFLAVETDGLGRAFLARRDASGGSILEKRGNGTVTVSKSLPDHQIVDLAFQNGHLYLVANPRRTDDLRFRSLFLELDPVTFGVVAEFEDGSSFDAVEGDGLGNIFLANGGALTKTDAGLLTMVRRELRPAEIILDLAFQDGRLHVVSTLRGEGALRHLDPDTLQDVAAWSTGAEFTNLEADGAGNLFLAIGHLLVKMDATGATAAVRTFSGETIVDLALADRSIVEVPAAAPAPPSLLLVIGTAGALLGRRLRAAISARRAGSQGSAA